MRSRRPKAEDELQLFSRIMSEIAVGLNVWELEDPADPAGMRLLYANPASELASGLAVDAILGRTMQEVFPEGTLAPVIAEVALGEEGRDLGNVVYRHGDVPERTFSVRVFPLPEQRAGVAFSEITGERSAQAQLLQALESMSDGFVAFDDQMRYTYINAEASRQLGYSRDELVGRKAFDIIPDAAAKPFFQTCRRALREQTPIFIEDRFGAR